MNLPVFYTKSDNSHKSYYTIKEIEHATRGEQPSLLDYFIKRTAKKGRPVTASLYLNLNMRSNMKRL